MKFLRNYIDKIKPSFEKGGKFEKLHSTFDAFETFLFVPNTVTVNGCHVKDSMDLKRAMSMVVIALIPSLLFGMYNVGLQHYLSIGQAETKNLIEMFFFGFIEVMPIVIVSYVVGLGIEFIYAQSRHHEVNEGFLVSGMLIPLIMPVDAPLWMIALSTAFAVVIGKEVFGGTGMNVFNPALLARAFMFFAYTPFISGEKIWVSGLTEGNNFIETYSGATPLTEMVNGITPHTSSMDWLIGTMPGCIGETSFIAIMIGALILLYTGMASWRIMFSVFGGGLLMGLIFNFVAPEGHMYMEFPFYHHILIGGFAFGAVFMATDPVTSSQTPTGQWIYGASIGILAVLVRVVNPAYPEGMMMAILFMNAMAPLIDHNVVNANIKRRNKRAIANK